MKNLIVLQTDFTFKEGAVAVMKGVIKSVDRELEILDLTHEIPQYDTYSASFRLRQVVPFYPKGIVFVSVVDPAVGSARKACVAKTQSGHLIVTPDNNTLTHLDRYVGLTEVRQIDKRWRYNSGYASEVFHGRDVFAYVGALLASAQVTFEELGPVYTDIQKVDYPRPSWTKTSLHGTLEIVDPNFGNVWTDIPVAYLEHLNLQPKDVLKITIAHDGILVLIQTLAPGSTFASVPLNAPVLYRNELDCLGLALNQNDYRNTYGIGFGPTWTITLEKAHA